MEEYKAELFAKLAKRVEKHNNMIERMFQLEGRMNEAEHDIRDLKWRVE